jgi:hypothetical protein
MIGGRGRGEIINGRGSGSETGSGMMTGNDGRIGSEDGDDE